MKRYPYAIHDWQDSDHYSAADQLDVVQWAWEFLRRNPEYQRLWDLFDSLPDAIDLEDGSSMVKCGKWKGTPWGDFAFLRDGAGWYADPEPIPGERLSQYEARCQGGAIMPFADYLHRRFKLVPTPIAPTDEPGEHHRFTDEWYEETTPPWEMRELLRRPDAWQRECLPKDHEMWCERIDAVANDETKVPVLFDLRYGIESQKTELEAILKSALATAEKAGRSIVRQQLPQYRPDQFAVHVRMLDAEAMGAHINDIAGALYPGLDGVAAIDRATKALKRAHEIRDTEYWRLRSPASRKPGKQRTGP